MRELGADTMSRAAGTAGGDSGHDSRLVRRVRLQLVAWSAGSTLVVLLVLGAAIYAAVATTLTSASETLLRDRASLIASTSAVVSVQAEPGAAGSLSIGTSLDPAMPGFIVAGPYSGTLGMVLPAAGVSGGPAIVSGVGGPTVETTVVGSSGSDTGTASAGGSPQAAEIMGSATVRWNGNGRLGRNPSAGIPGPC